MAKAHYNRRFYVDDETERLLVVDDGSEPEGALVEEITALDWYLRAGHQLTCGWPLKHHAAGPNLCPCGFVFPARAPEDWHSNPDDDEALS